MEKEEWVKEELNQIKRIHARVAILWKQKEKYMVSMKKSQNHIEEISKKENNADREKLIEKLKLHIERVLVQYMPVVNEMAALKVRSQVCFQNLSLVMELDTNMSEQIVQAAEMVQQVDKVVMQASSF